MPNPLFGPGPSKDAPQPYTEWREPAGGAFSVLLPAGWSATGRLVKAMPNFMTACLDVKTAAGGLVFIGDADVPLSYVLPQPWMPPFLGPMDRVSIHEGASQREALVGPHPGTASRYALTLARKRFGNCRAVHAAQVPGDIDAVYRGAAQAGGGLSFVDVARCRFACEGGMVGEVKLALFNGFSPTWDVDFVEGFRVPPAEVALARAVLASLTILNIDGRRDVRPPAVVAQFVKALRDADAKDRENLINANKAILAAKAGAIRRG